VNGVDKTLWARLSPLLDEFLDLAESARATRLAAVRSQDPALADALAGMLAKLPAIEREGFLDTPAMPRPAGLAGQAIGAYKLEREIGQGGMGTVWLARRTDGRYQGEVAIKFLRAGIFGHGDAGRFEREGSILARLSHPHIARLLDAGVTGNDAQPYLVLEYIDGEPIDAYCQRLALPTAARLALFLDVLSAVAHAHNRLILHRDLKPSNILVTPGGDVKLLDFGIAKLLDAAGGGAATELTGVAGNAFTPQFAAPEQLQGGDVTTATDVYALGVLLYMLLGGSHPTVAPTEAPLDRMRAVIEIEPKRLSDAVLRRGGPNTTWSAASRKLASELRGDVDTILARALKKSPAERYANAADLADDIRRYLAHEPIAARPDARLYRIAKFMRRNRAGVAAASIAVAALGAGVAIALWQAREAGRQRVQAEGLIEFMLGDLRRKLEPVGRLDALDAVGTQALAYYAAQDTDRLDADSLGRRARALHLIGDLAEQGGKLDEAQRDFQQAADSTAELVQRHPDDGQRLFDHSQSEYWLGYIEWRRGHLHEAEAAFRRYYAVAERMTQVAPGNPDFRLERAYAAQNVAIALLDLGRPAESLALGTEAVSTMTALAPSRPDAILEAANAMGWVARAHENLGHYEEAMEIDDRKVKMALTAPGGAANQGVAYLAAVAHGEKARLLLDLGRAAEAEPLGRQAVEEQERLVKLDPSNLDWLNELLLSRMYLGNILLARGDLEGVRAQLAAVEAPIARLAATKGARRAWRIGLVAHATRLRGAVARSPGEIAAAERALAAFLADVRRFESDGNIITMEEAVQIPGNGLVEGDLVAWLGRAADARAAWIEAARRLQPLAAKGEPRAMTLLGRLDVRLGNLQAAQVLADRVRATSYRHPAYADLIKTIDQAQKTGASPGS
jgi:serine/threonine-protein kinase